MSKLIIAVLFVTIIFSSVSFGQQMIKTDKDTIELCWSNSSTDSITSLVYYRDFVFNNDTIQSTTWNLIGETKGTTYKVSKGSKKAVVFGIASTIYGDTSEITQTIDVTSCLDVNGDCSSVCSVTGGWYLRWLLKGPKGIKLINR